MKSQKAKKGVCRRVGNRAAQIKKYYLTRYPRKKIRNILKSEGYSQAQAWAAKHGVTATFIEIAKELGMHSE